jgi:hypothetical protein
VTGKKKGSSASESEYEQKRKANIEENKKLLSSLGLDKDVGILGKSLLKKEKKK